MTALTMNLFYHTEHGPNGELKDWYYHFKGNSGDDFVIHELSHTDMKQKITKKHKKHDFFNLVLFFMQLYLLNYILCNILDFQMTYNLLAGGVPPTASS